MSAEVDLGFVFHAQGVAEVRIMRGGKVVTVLRGRRALDFHLREPPDCMQWSMYVLA